MILVDTSVWIDFFASKPFPHIGLLEKLILNDNDFLLIEGKSLTHILEGHVSPLDTI